MAEEITVSDDKTSQTGSHDLTHPLQQRAEMDVVLAVKNLLALEDHLREFIPESEDEEQWRTYVLKDVEDLRTTIFLLLDEKDKRYHCMAKHSIAATGALEEVSKLYHKLPNWPQSDDFDFYAERCREIQIAILEKLWGHEIENCKRCK